MISKPRLLIIQCIILLFTVGISAESQSLNHAFEQQTIARKIRFQNPDSSLMLYNKAKTDFLIFGDTLEAVKTLVQSSNIYTSKGNYSKSYDAYWQALILSNTIKDSTISGDLYGGLGVLYSLFGKYEKAEVKYKKSIAFNKALVEENAENKSKLVGAYYLYASYHREKGNFGMGQVYLDSCIMMLKQDKLGLDDAPYVKAEQGYLKLFQGKKGDGIKMLLDTEKYFLKRNKTFLVIVYSFLGDAYLMQGNTLKSEQYYLKSLEISNKYNSHQNYIPAVYQKLGDLYFASNREHLAYSYLQTSKDLNDELFGARSINNSNLLEIQDAFRLKLESQKEYQKKVRLNELEQESRISFLRITILSISLLSFLIIAVFVFWYLRSGYRNDQQLAENEQRLMQKKNEAILELKNKELITSALQLIEKDELLIEIKTKLGLIIKSGDEYELKPILSKIKSNSKHDWKEFNARFTSVNKHFYNTLGQKFPELTQGEHKLCALIKLNFSSKDMALLLGIAIESVHSSRYRLRKKMHLSKSENLTEFIAKM